MKKLAPISLKRSPVWNETWVQEQIADDPTILGLGDLNLRDRERIQANAGRLDLLLQDPETLKRFEVELQLGATDESHIIRTIEYWDIERRRYPQYEHAAVIVAEDITSRFLNVIQLFNGAIPLIALKMTAYEVDGDVALTFVKVVDEMTFGLVDEDEPVAEPTDREYWLNKASEPAIRLTDQLLELVREVEPGATLRYNKNYVGLWVQGQPLNFVVFRPRKGHVVMTIRTTRSVDIDERLEQVEIETLTYRARSREYRLRLNSVPEGEERELLLTMMQQSRREFGGGPYEVSYLPQPA